METSVPRPRSAEDWVLVLEESHKWGCKKIRGLAVDRLKTIPMDHVRKIAIWRQYRLDEADIAPSYHALATRTQPLTTEEGRLLDIDTVVKIAAIRDRVQQGVLDYLNEPPPAGWSVLPSERVRDLICRAFLMELRRA